MEVWTIDDYYNIKEGHKFPDEHIKVINPRVNAIDNDNSTAGNKTVAAEAAGGEKKSFEQD